MMLRAAATSQRDDDTDVKSSELSNRVSVRVPASSSTGEPACRAYYGRPM